MKLYLGEALVVHDGEVFEADALAVEVDEREHESLGLERVDAVFSLESCASTIGLAKGCRSWIDGERTHLE
jgi:hypothetical protein